MRKSTKKTAIHRKNWWNFEAYSGMVAFADFNNWRFALPEFGPEMVINGDFFSGTTGWTAVAPAVLTNVSGQLAITNTGGANGRAIIPTAMESGKIYQITIGTMPQVLYISADGSSLNYYFRTFSPGTFYFTPSSSPNYIGAYNTGPDGSVAYLDNISVREVLTNGTKREATFNEWFAYTASSTTARTYVGQDGLLKSDLVANVPRQDWRNGKRQIRLEDARTNLLLRSQDIANATWSKQNSTVVAAATTAPDGTLTAASYSQTSVSNNVAQTVTVVSGAAHTFSIYAKNGPLGNNWIELAVVSTSTWRVYFNLATGTKGSAVGSPLAYTIKPIVNGWYRIDITVTTGTTTAACYVQARANDNDLVTFPGVGISSYLWGAQMEAAAFASDYIRCDPVAVTRAIETARFSPLMEAIIQRGAGTIVARGVNPNPRNGRVVGLLGVDALISLGNTAVASDTECLPVRAGFTPVGPVASLPSGTWTNPFGISTTWDAAGQAICANGGTVASNANLISQSRTEVYLARSGAGLYANGNYDFIGIYPDRLSNATLQALALPA